MSDSLVRDYVMSVLKPLVPSTWKLDPGIPSKMHSLAKPLMWLEYTAFEPLPEAPLSKIAASVDVCIVTNLTDVRKGEDDADEAVFDLFGAAMTSNAFYRITAAKSVFWDAYIGWRLSLTVITTTTSEE